MRKFLIAIVVLVLVALPGAVWLFSTPDIMRVILDDKYASPASEFLILPDGANVHVRDEGPRDAPVLLLVHGSNASLLTWEPWVKRLSNSLRLVTLDMPGHGLTGAVPDGDYSQAAMVRAVKETADKLHLEKFAIGGNSMGGGVAARFAELYPARITHLILVDAAGMPTQQGTKIPLAFKIARIPVLNRIMLYVTPRSMVREGLETAIVRKDIITDAMIDSYWNFARMEGTRAATLARFSLPPSADVARDIAKIKAPTLILWGAQDSLIPVASAHLFAKAIAGSRLIVYPATGHLPQEEVADQSAADVRRFLGAP
ncbi:MAG TPA: alpha/beta hydrolase [Rhizomicrobium sp.]|nr:alpha/beta hydrolase [Rhizomicrobium sp.]